LLECSLLAARCSQKYQSVASDWSDAAFACSGFSFSDPQYFRYRWLQTSAASGEIQAEADLDGDGIPDNVFRQIVSCNGTSCAAEPPIVGPVE
jgi:hypothetical protein